MINNYAKLCNNGTAQATVCFDSRAVPADLLTMRPNDVVVFATPPGRGSHQHWRVVGEDSDCYNLRQVSLVTALVDDARTVQDLIAATGRGSLTPVQRSTLRDLRIKYSKQLPVRCAPIIVS